jgi:gentisate 1,2-dioxygenase
MAEQSGRATRLEAMYTEMAAHSLEGLWRMERTGPDVRPYLWQWDAVHRAVTAAGEFVDIPYPGERRAVALVNPGIPGALGSTHAIYTAIQLVRPGEVARAHRHTPNALRFMIEGAGVSTTVEGERVPMYPGDLVLTPNWLWHEHRNDSEADAMWLDGLDSPLIFGLAAAVYEPFEDGFITETRPEDHSGRSYGLGTIRPIGYEAPAKGAPLLVYRWAAVEPAILRMAEDGAATEFDAVSIEYVNPGTGGHTLSTMSCWMTMLRPGEHTKAHRHTYSSVYHAHRGKGSTIINGQRFEWAERDSFVVPPWTWHEHVNASESEVAYLFSINDIPTLEAFDLNREEPLTETGGHQQVTSGFDPEDPGER